MSTGAKKHIHIQVRLKVWERLRSLGVAQGESIEFYVAGILRKHVDDNFWKDAIEKEEGAEV